MVEEQPRGGRCDGTTDADPTDIPASHGSIIKLILYGGKMSLFSKTVPFALGG